MDPRYDLFTLLFLTFVLSLNLMRVHLSRPLLGSSLLGSVDLIKMGGIPLSALKKLPLRFHAVLYQDCLSPYLTSTLHLQCKCVLHTCKMLSLLVCLVHSPTLLNLHVPTTSCSHSSVHTPPLRFSHSVSWNLQSSLALSSFFTFTSLHILDKFTLCAVAPSSIQILRSLSTKLASIVLMLIRLNHVHSSFPSGITRLRFSKISVNSTFFLLFALVTALFASKFFLSHKQISRSSFLCHLVVVPTLVHQYHAPLTALDLNFAPNHHRHRAHELLLHAPFCPSVFQYFLDTSATSSRALSTTSLRASTIFSRRSFAWLFSLRL